MTDRIRHLTVTLDKSYRDDDLTLIATAIGQIRGVADVTPRIETLPDILARVSVAGAIRIKLHEAIEAVFVEENKKP